MGADVAASLKANTILDAAMEEIKRVLLPLRLFSTKFEREPRSWRGNKIISVPYYPLETQASRDYNQATGYTVDREAKLQAKDVTINKRKYQDLSISSDDWNTFSDLDFEKVGRNKGRKLAEDVLMDVLSIVTQANFGAAIINVAEDEFDSEELLVLDKAAIDLFWPVGDRGLILNSSLDPFVKRDPQARYAAYSGDSGVWRNASLGNRLAGFNYECSAVLPANGERLAGFMVFPSAILVGMTYIEPEPSVREKLTAFEVMADEEVGITLAYRQWGDPDADVGRRIIECTYGFAKGEDKALRRITTPAA